MVVVYGGGRRALVATGLFWALLGPVLSACSASHAAPHAGSGASAPVRRSPGVVPSVRSLPAGTAIAPGANAVVGESAGVRAARLVGPPTAPPVGTLRELQMNLCNSGEASCYTGGRAVEEASTLMRRVAAPDMVTLNEVCRRDVTDRLGSVMAGLWPYDDIVYLFAPAVNATGGSYRCQDGDVFGNGLIARVPAGRLTVLDTRYGMYAAQVTNIERRTFGCVDLAPRILACVTHLESDSAAVAATQCTTLMSRVVPALRGNWGASTPVIVAGDMNLGAGMTACTPAGFRQVGDGGVQHVLASAGSQFLRIDEYPMKQTDHAALLVALALG